MSRKGQAQAAHTARGVHGGRHANGMDLIGKVVSAFFVIVLVTGLGLLGYPTVADWWNRMHQSTAVGGYIAATDDLSEQQRASMLQAARDYNQKLLSSPDRWRPTAEETEAYDHTLDVTGTGIMGYVTVPKLQAQFPIYHGTNEEVLQIAIGHLEGSSLPVGGASTHAVVSGHTGLPSARLFTGLDTLVPGDTFAFHVLGETLTYQVDQINVVLPDNLSNLNIDDGQDYATLVTCTPYGVNTHRLLVRGHRISTPAGVDGTDYGRPVRIMSMMIAAAAVVLLVGAGVIVEWQLAVRRSRVWGQHVRGRAGVR